MNKSKLNFLQQIKYAITKPMKYFQLTKASGYRVTGFVFLFVLITSLFTIIPKSFSLVGPNGYINTIINDIPAFELSNGQLNMEKPYKYENDILYISVDTNVDSFSSKDMDATNFYTILISKSNIVYDFPGQTFNIKFSDIEKFHFNNGDLKNLKPLLYIVIILAGILRYLFNVGIYFLTALLFSLVGIVISVMEHSNLKYSIIFKTAIYAKVTTNIIGALLSILPIYIPVLFTMGLFILINCAYVVYGTLSHNSEEAREDASLNSPSQMY